MTLSDLASHSLENTARINHYVLTNESESVRGL